MIDDDYLVKTPKKSNGQYLNSHKSEQDIIFLFTSYYVM